MKVYQSKSLRRETKSRLQKWLFVASFAAFILIVGFVFQFVSVNEGRIFHRLGYIGVLDNNHGFISTVLHGIRTFVRTSLSSNQLESIDIRIKYNDFEKLKEKRKQALRRKILYASEDDFVPAKIAHRGKTSVVKIRLKGDFIDHLGGKKWSFRIKTKGDQHLMGMRVYSVQHPRVRNFHYEPIFFDLLRKEGVIAPRYFFVNVSVNGEDIGVMAIEEHFSKELLEYNQRRESVILRFDERLFFTDYPGFSRLYNWRNSEILPFRKTRIAKSETLKREAKLSINLLNSFREGKLPSSEVFDLNTMSTFLALSELWGISHGIRWHNFRFYFNPVLARLEPVAYDCSSHFREIANIDLILKEPFVRELLKDSKMKLAVNAKLAYFSRRFRSLKTIEWLNKKERNEYLPALQSEFPLLRKSNFSYVRSRARVRLKVSSRELKPPVVLKANFVSGKKNENWIELINLVPYPILIEEWVVKDLSVVARRYASITEVPKPLRIAPSPKGRPLTKKRIPVKFTSIQNKQISVKFRIQGRKKVYSADVKTSPYDEILYSPVSLAVDSNEFEALHRRYLKKDRKEKNFYFRKGHWKVKGSLIVPYGYGLEIPAGTTLQFSKNEGLVVNGPIFVRGNESEPVKLMGSPMWSGVFVRQAAKKSELSNVFVTGVQGFIRKRWALNAGIVFYETAVAIDNLILMDSATEDAINIVRSTFDLENIFISNTDSDGIDVDFSTGSLKKLMFQNIGGDAIDLSGSKILVSDAAISGVRDKAISVGEKSELVAKNIKIIRAGTGVASKDLSQVEISKSRFGKIDYASLVAFTKKNEYGPAVIKAQDVVADDGSKLAIADLGSRIEVNGRVVKSTRIDTDRLYREGPMEK